MRLQQSQHPSRMGEGMVISSRSLRRLGTVGVFTLLAVTLPSASTAELPMQVFVLAGQSNMVGRAQPISGGTGPTANLMLWRDGAWEQAKDPLGPASEPDRGVGPGMTFGIEVLSHEPSGTTVGLIMCARGETSIGNWGPGAHIYNQCKQAARRAGGQIAGVVFLQGEHEAGSPNGGAVWAKGFEKSEQAFERDFGPTPFVLGQIGSLDPLRAPFQQQVRDAQAASAAAHPEITLVTTTDLPVDGVHFTLSAEKTLGTRFGEAWYTLSQREPALADIDPGSGLAGDTVTITGSNLDLATSVTFGSLRSSYQIDSDTQITATVPESAVTGAVKVTTLLGIATAPSPFAVLPTVGSFEPNSGRPGTVVKLSGNTFKGVTLVTLNGAPAAFKVRSSTRLRLTVPSGATSGHITVTNASGTTISAGTFTVL
jgi:hypothetical protein